MNAVIRAGEAGEFGASINTCWEQRGCSQHMVSSGQRLLCLSAGHKRISGSGDEVAECHPGAGTSRPEAARFGA